MLVVVLRGAPSWLTVRRASSGGDLRSCCRRARVSTGYPAHACYRHHSRTAHYSRHSSYHQNGAARRGTARRGTARHGTAQHGTVRDGTARDGTSALLPGVAASVGGGGGGGADCGRPTLTGPGGRLQAGPHARPALYLAGRCSGEFPGMRCTGAVIGGRRSRLVGVRGVVDSGR